MTEPPNQVIFECGELRGNCAALSRLYDANKFLDVERLRQSRHEVWVFKVSRFIVEARDDDELGLDVLPAGEELENHLARETRHLEIEQYYVELMIRIREYRDGIVAVAKDGDIVFLAEYGEEKESNGGIVVYD